MSTISKSGDRVNESDSKGGIAIQTLNVQGNVQI